ncbi:MAG: DNA polymerase III subunit delta', partial [Sphingomonadales bacterium]|nr:DNA polymerase III subunit delta' [Sphingomonadales bacterium]
MNWIGHDAAEQALIDGWNSGRLHHAWLLAGPKGIGKATFARRAAQFLLAQGEAPTDSRPVTTLDVADDTPARRLVEAGSHPDFRTIERQLNDKTGNLARGISIDQIRQATMVLGSTKGRSRYRAIIIDSADDLEAGGANALLKSLEEPPADTVFFLISHSSGRLLPTIRSRCRSLVFRAIGDDVMASWLHDVTPGASAADIAALLALAAGSPGRAMRFRDAGLAPLWRDLETLLTDGDRDLSIASRLSQGLALKSANDRYEAFLELVP